MQKVSKSGGLGSELWEAPNLSGWLPHLVGVFEAFLGMISMDHPYVFFVFG